METAAQEISFINTRPGFIYDQEFKIVYIGDRFCGKTQFKNRFCKNKFSCKSQSTIGVEFSSKSVRLPDNKVAKLQLWDTAGQEKNQSISSVFYRNADGILLFYDIAREFTFEKVKNYWLNQVRKYAPAGVPVIVVGNKRDLEIIRKVNSFEAYRFAVGEGVKFMEGSALTGENVDQIHASLVKEMIKKQKEINNNHVNREFSSRKQIIRLCNVTLEEKSPCC